VDDELGTRGDELGTLGDPHPVAAATPLLPSLRERGLGGEGQLRNGKVSLKHALVQPIAYSIPFHRTMDDERQTIDDVLPSILYRLSSIVGAVLALPLQALLQHLLRPRQTGRAKLGEDRDRMAGIGQPVLRLALPYKCSGNTTAVRSNQLLPPDLLG
jgi:hypothetical protein